MHYCITPLPPPSFFKRKKSALWKVLELKKLSQKQLHGATRLINTCSLTSSCVTLQLQITFPQHMGEKPVFLFSGLQPRKLLEGTITVQHNEEGLLSYSHSVAGTEIKQPGSIPDSPLLYQQDYDIAPTLRKVS